MYLRSFENFVVRHIGEYSRQAPGAKSLTRSRRTDQQKIMGARSRNLERPFYSIHPHNIFKIGNVCRNRKKVPARHPRGGANTIKITAFQKFHTFR